MSYRKTKILTENHNERFWPTSRPPENVAMGGGYQMRQSSGCVFRLNSWSGFKFWWHVHSPFPHKCCWWTLVDCNRSSLVTLLDNGRMAHFCEIRRFNSVFRKMNLFRIPHHRRFLSPCDIVLAGLGKKMTWETRSESQIYRLHFMSKRETPARVTGRRHSCNDPLTFWLPFWESIGIWKYKHSGNKAFWLQNTAKVPKAEYEQDKVQKLRLNRQTISRWALNAKIMPPRTKGFAYHAICLK